MIPRRVRHVPVRTDQSQVYTAAVLTLPEELRPFLDHDGPPLPIIDPDEGRGYMLMPVTFSGRPGRIVARVPGIRAAGEGNQATEALATLAWLIKDNLDQL